MPSRNTAWRLSALLAGIDAPARGGLAPDLVITGITSDSRQVQPGDLFLAVQGHTQHGRTFIPQAIHAGAAAILSDDEDSSPLLAAVLASQRADSPQVPVLTIPQISHRVGLLASRFFHHPSQALTTIGITGTDGKTSVAHFIAQALSQPNTPCGLIGTLGYGVFGATQPATHTTPDAITLQRQLAALRDRGVTAVAMEVSSHALDQRRVVGVDFTVAVLTHLSRDHLDYHGTVEAYAAAKRRLFLDHHPRFAVLNRDDAFGQQRLVELTASSFQITTVAYGLRSPPAHATYRAAYEVWAESVTAHPAGLDIHVHSPWGEGTLSVGLLGAFNAYNLLAALSTLLILGIPFTDAIQRLQVTAPVPGRMERFGAAGQPLVVVDYAHTPNALAQALMALRAHVRGRLFCVFGCGGDRDVGKRPLMGQAAARYADQIILTDDNPRTEAPDAIVHAIQQGIHQPDRVAVIQPRAHAIQAAIAHAGPEDAVLIAGKGHENYQIIGLEKHPFSDRDEVCRALSERITSRSSVCLF